MCDVVMCAVVMCAVVMCAVVMCAVVMCAVVMCAVVMCAVVMCAVVMCAVVMCYRHIGNVALTEVTLQYNVTRATQTQTMRTSFPLLDSIDDDNKFVSHSLLIIEYVGQCVAGILSWYT